MQNFYSDCPVNAKAQVRAFYFWTFQKACLPGAMFFLFTFFGSFVGYLGSLPTAIASSSSASQLKVPQGFSVSIYADGVKGARSMTRTDSDLVFVSSRDQGVVYALFPEAQLSKVRLQVVSTQFPGANGIAWWAEDLYIADTNNLYVAKKALSQIQTQSANSGQPIELAFERLPILFPSHPADKRYPTGTVHGWKYMRFDSRGRLYVSIGAPCNVCNVEDPYASIVRFDPSVLVENEDLLNWSKVEVVARGVRNSLGFDWSPTGEDLWFTDNGRDLLGDDVPPDELNRVQFQAPLGANYGFPWCLGAGDLDVFWLSGSSTLKSHNVDCKDANFFRRPMATLGAHVAALGMRFYRGAMFDSPFNDSILIAEHGSWNRTQPSGYRVSAVTGISTGSLTYQPLVEGWLNGSGQVGGRPVDVENLSDGSILISDELGKIWRLTYKK